MSVNKQEQSKTAHRGKGAAMNRTTERDHKERPRKSPKQIAALVCVFLLIAMYAATLVVACLDLADSGRLFAGCLLMTIALPILLWIYIWLYGIYRDRHNMASLDMLHSDEYTGTNAAPADASPETKKEQAPPLP